MKATSEPRQGEPQGFACRVCGDIDSHPSYRIREMMFGTRESFEYFQCKACDCLQIARIPDDLSKYYPAGYYSHQHSKTNIRDSLLRRALEKLLISSALFGNGYKLSRIANLFISLPDYFFRARPNLLKRAGIRNFDAQILDVGCGGQAQWLQDLRRTGFRNLCGIDPFINADLTIHGIPIRKTDIFSFASSSSGQFDLVTLHHSLEHIPNQIDTLSAIKKLLSPTGTCAIRIPTVSSLAWEKYGVNWVELDAPRHLYLHSKRSLQGLAESIGLELFEIQYDTTAFEFYGSSQYKLDIPLTDPRSLWINPESTIFTDDEKREFKELANQVNREESAGRACFFFRHANQ